MSGVSVNQIRSHLNELEALNGHFTSLSTHSVDKFEKIIATAKVYQTKMDPLNKDVEQLQTQQKNIQECFSKLSQIQTYRKTGSEVESLVEQGPSQSLEAYLRVLERIQHAFIFFRENNVEEVEFIRLQSLYTLGLRNVNREFDAMLKQTFRPINMEHLLKMAEFDRTTTQSVDPDDLRALEDASDHMLNSLQFIMEWLQQSRSFDTSGDGARSCLSRYYDYRRDVVRQTLVKLRTLLKRRDSPSSGQYWSKNVSNSVLPRSRPKRPPGFIWEANTYRHSTDGESDELNSEHYAISVIALVKLMQNEKRWLNRLQLTTNEQEMRISLDMILKVASNEVLTEGGTLVRFMQQAQTHAEFHMILSLLLVLKKFALIGPELIDILRGIDHILFGFNSLAFKLLQQTCNTLEAYVEFLRQLPEHSGPVRAQVPPGGTVHELTTNAFMYLENLLEFADVMSVAVHVNDIGPQGNSNVLTFLSNNVANFAQFRPRVGAFLLSAIFALIANLDRKSESYSEEMIRLIFRMNNLQYILKMIQKTELQKYLLSYDPDAIARINSILDERRGRYSLIAATMLRLQPSAGECASSSLRRRASQFGAAIASVLSPTLGGHASLRPSNIISVNSTSESDRHIEPGPVNTDELIKLDTKERAALKSLWHDFNNGLTSLIRQHSNVTVPDRELRETLERQLVADLIPPYKIFWDRSATLGFTSHREKYMRVTVQEFETRLRQLLIDSGR